MRDPYEVLGVQRSASAAEIKSAFRKLAKKHPPDANKNDAKAAARFAEINDRNAAERLRSTVLTVPREALPALDKGEYYYSDLIGLPCISTDGTDLGKCVAVENFGASDVLEIEMPSLDGKPGKKFMVPMTANAVPEWGERILIDAAFVI